MRNLVFVLGRMSGLLQQWNATLIEPTHNYDRFGADALFHPKNMEELDVSRAWPPDDYLWLWKTVGAEGNSRGWDVVCEEDAQQSPEARLLLRKQGSQRCLAATCHLAAAIAAAAARASGRLTRSTT